ncbi:MAG: hypothetical protein EB124_01845 [Betaproteobacteria bacterium]|nr:hypothetical protein [Betaproteobacteria bacterium]
MGYRPKSLLQLDGVPLICRQLIALSGAGVDEVVVVLGHHAELIEPVIKDFAVTVVRNMHPEPDDVEQFTRDTGQLLHWHETVPIPQEKPDA